MKIKLHPCFVKSKKKHKKANKTHTHAHKKTANLRKTKNLTKPSNNVVFYNGLHGMIKLVNNTNKKKN